MTLRPCLTCGLPSEETYCDKHAPKSWQHRETSARARGYDTAWDKLSRRARRIQPWCSLCLSTDDLTTDHLPEAWRRKAEGKSIRLRDVRVLCSPCNVDAGSSRPNDQGRGTLDARSGPAIEAKSRLLIGVKQVSQAGSTEDVDAHPAVRAHDERRPGASIWDDRQDPVVHHRVRTFDLECCAVDGFDPKFPHVESMP